MRNICQIKLAMHKREKKIDGKREGERGKDNVSSCSGSATSKRQVWCTNPCPQMELNFLSVGAFVCCLFVHSLACEFRRLFFARNMLHAATWQRGNAMCLPVAVLAGQKHSISLIYTSEAVRAQPRSKLLSPALFLHSYSLFCASHALSLCVTVGISVSAV